MWIKSCQMDETEVKHILVGTPNTIPAKRVKKTMDRELQALEKEVMTTSKDNFSAYIHEKEEWID